ncbi:MAG: hypothetical protein P4N41_10705 [Negativicutes bacterium]|nr:hypothetical protein [Negativicutes bacterium]
MAKFLCGILVGLSLLWPGTVQAADIKYSLSVTRQADGTIFGEVFRNDQVLWRLKVCGDGAEPVAGTGSASTTVIVPDIVNGLFLLKLHNQ